MERILPQEKLVSVIISTFNSERFIRETIESFLGQTYKDFELIVGDDGSTDATCPFVQELAQKDRRIKLVACRHEGSSAAKNAALKHCRGAYVAVSDADDISYPGRLACEKKFLDEHPQIGLVGTNFDYINEQGKVFYTHKVESLAPSGEVSSSFLKQKLRWMTNHFLHSSVMFRRQLLEDVGGYDETFAAALDYDFILRCAEHTEVAVLPEVLAAWRRHGHQITYCRSELQRRNTFRALGPHLRVMLAKAVSVEEKKDLESCLRNMEKKEEKFMQAVESGDYRRQEIYDEAYNVFHVDHDYRKALELYRKYAADFRFSLKTLKAWGYVVMCLLRQEGKLSQ